jgi:4-aminobutyrate aminotransferase / (S)-3-amino-2-methylpropionate transaminase / 5-aminovalerate transaminase
MITEKGASIKTALPGPKAQELLAKRDENIARGISYLVPTFVEEAQGALVKDVDGNVFIDFAGGIGVTNAGHAPQQVVDAIKAQAEKFLHTCFMVAMYEPAVELASRLNALTPGDYPKKTMLANSGAEAVENAVKFARRYTGRTGIVSFECAFHGRTLLAMSLTSKVKPYKYKFGPFAPDTYKVPSPYCYRCSFGQSYPGCSLQCLKQIERFFVTECPPDTIAAFIIEPVQGEGGFIVPPPEFLRGLKELAESHGILFIADEIQTGFYRTGSLFSISQSGVVPDIVTTAKSLASGMPLSAITGRAEIMDAPDKGEVGGTYGGNPLSCVAALKTLEIMQETGFAERAAEIGERTRARFLSMQEKYPIIGDVRGQGAMLAMEMVKDRVTKEPLPVKDIVAYAVNKGLILLSAGIYSNVIRVLMPLVITDEQLEEGLSILEEAVRSCCEV